MGRSGRRTAPRAAVLAATTALLLAGCTGAGPGTDEPGPAESSPATTAPPSGSSPSDGGASDDPGPDRTSASGDPDDTPEPGATATETAPGPPFAADARPDTAEPVGEGQTFLSVTDIRTAERDGYDRIVFDLEGKGSGSPGWRVEYVDQATDDGSGHSVDVNGDAILRVSLSGTATPMDSGVDELARDRFEPDDTESVEEVVFRYWFEGYTTTFLGVDEAERPFRVFLLENPTRVVVDVQH